MTKTLLASILCAVIGSGLLVNFTCAQTRMPNRRDYLRNRMKRGIDEGMLKRAPLTGDEDIARRAPENIDNGIYTPKSIRKSYRRTNKPELKRR